ncbi:protein of unknown function [Filimonas lacunae]|uniref:Type 9 secretion system plug protein N-terminal domain-containing protein n=1 Tax=Filimonas lacunae TaxID=477680 RepID=A0A173ML15_9BACT|nr:DUF5103 domain-containing protein [Filimonas lacunae]BAV08180.1 hypothetical protein FLA_4213 [Filimonas lacunae]SIT10454.1 protein of unknown function [Filimonas lacunae]
MKQYCILAIGVLMTVTGMAQQRLPDQVYMDNIQAVSLFAAGDQTTYPAMTTGSIGALELHFDDLDAYVKNYSYTYQLCNANWTPVDLSPFDYLAGFTQNRLTQYRNSSIATTQYVHYQATLPERNCVPNKSGNYLLKVYLNGDTSQLAFTRRILVFDQVVPVSAQVLQPFDQTKIRSHQKIQFTLDKTALNILNPSQQLQVVVMQNYRWDNAIAGKQPMFMRGNLFEYNGERDFLFPAGKEYRWVDLGSYRFLSDRMDHANLKEQPFQVWLKPDGERTQGRYMTYADLNGFSEARSTDNINVWWQGDYATVNFVYVPLSRQPYPGKDVYLAGQFTNYQYNDQTRLTFNAEKGVYETTMFLKQGYYTYTYATTNTGESNHAEVALTDGNYWETENAYTILVYYRGFSDRYDRLVGYTTINSRTVKDSSIK